MRLLFDLFPCQTSSRLRGIGRYTISLTQAMARQRGSHTIIAMANPLYPESFEELRQEFIRLLPPGSFKPYFQPPITGYESIPDIHAKIAQTFVRQAYQVLSPEVVLYPSVFEGWCEQGVVPLPDEIFPSSMRAAIVYDFIPYLFADEFLNNNLEYKAWYVRRMESFKNFDLLLAISEATRQDAIRLLQIPAERVINISAAATSSVFSKKASSPEAAQPEAVQALLKKQGISRPFIFYTGTADYHKNVAGMLRAYAALPAGLRLAHQLVITQTKADDAFRAQVRTLGLSEDEVLFLGHITDEELATLYAECKLFIFPSLYEGFGLPILEAMSCGAPVIAGDNSSLPEVVGRNDALFDASNPKAITEALVNVLTNEDFRLELKAYGPKQASQFTWDISAQRAWQAIEAVQKQGKAERQVYSMPQKTSKDRIAYVASPQSQDAVRHPSNVEILSALMPHFKVDLFLETPGDNPDLTRRDKLDTYAWTELLSRRSSYATVVYQIDSLAPKQDQLDLLQEFPGVVILPDSFLGKWNLDLKAIDQSFGLRGMLDFLKLDPGKFRQKWPGNRKILKYAQALVLFSEEQKNCVEQLGGAESTIQPELLKSTADLSKIIKEAIQTDERRLFAPAANTLAKIGAGNDQDKLKSLAKNAAANLSLREPRRILIDVTQISHVDARSGIQRVVKNLVLEFFKSSDCSTRLELVRNDSGIFYRSSRLAERLFELQEGSLGEEMMISIHPVDLLFMLDSSWHLIDDFIPAFKNVHRLGGKVISTVYDLIPVRFEQYTDEGMIRAFGHWIQTAIAHSDEIICISRSVADDVAAFIQERDLKPKQKLDLGYFHLGANIQIVQNESALREEMKTISGENSAPLFIMVGTIEPRKGYSFVLDAFDQLWQHGIDCRLCFAGKVGWKVEAMHQRILNHPELGKRFFFLENPSDAEINRCYQSATALIAASTTEGFGLPIVEAALHKVPTLASDIPVFHEVGGDGAIYFSLTSPNYLVQAVKQMSSLTQEQRLGMAEKVQVLTWKDSADWVIKLLNGEAVYRSI